MLLIEILLYLQCEIILKTIIKYNELHRKIKAAGWKKLRSEGSHFIFIKDGKMSPPVPYHGAKEVPEGLRRKIAAAMGL